MIFLIAFIIALAIVCIPVAYEIFRAIEQVENEKQ